MPMPAPPFRPLVVVLAMLDAALLVVFVGALAYDRAFPSTCPPAPGSRITLPCITPAQALAIVCLLLLAALVLLTLILLVLSQALLMRRNGRSRATSHATRDTRNTHNGV
jgi:hypothetical protein